MILLHVMGKMKKYLNIIRVFIDFFKAKMIFLVVIPFKTD
jgi:hypothetical protein